jgi:uncharacterized protein (TIGR02453 family)
MTFRGWPAEALEFYEGLEADNSKTYWTAHKAVYDGAVWAPMTELLAELEPEFGTGKIFRPYRDVRFSADKSPYKTHLAGWLERGGYIQLSATGLACGRGSWMMSADQLDRYRRAVADERGGTRLERIVEQLAGQHVTVSGGHDELRTAPRGYPRDHPRVRLLRYKGLVAWREWPVAAWLGTPAAKRRVVDFLHAARPLSDWLTEHVGPAAPAED